MFQRALARKAAILVGHLNQASDLAKQHVLVGIKHAVGEGHLPEHLDDLDPLLGVEAFADLVGEGKVLGRILNPALGLLDKLLHGFGSEIESFREQAPDRGPLGGIKIAVHARRLDQERGNG